MGFALSSHAKPRENPTTVPDPRDVIKDFKIHISLLEEQAKAMVSSMQSQRTVVEKILEHYKKESSGTSVDDTERPCSGAREATPVLPVEHYLLKLLDCTQITETSQANAMKLEVSSLRAFVDPVLQQFEGHLAQAWNQTKPDIDQSASLQTTPECRVLQDENARLNSETMKTKKECDMLRKEISKLSDEIKKLNADAIKKEDKIRDNERKIQEQQLKYQQRESELHQQSQKEMDKLKEELRRFQDESRRFLRKTVAVQLYCTRKDELVDRVMSEFSRMLQTMFDTERIDVNTQIVKELKDIQKNLPLVVICIQASRLGTDVDNGLRGLDSQIVMGNVVCVVLHHKEIHTLPTQPSSTLLFSTQVKQLGGMVDMAFVRDKGMYPCELNNAALSHLVQFIKGHPGNNS